MGVSYAEAESHLSVAVNQIFSSDPMIRAVGITRHQSEYGYRAVRNAALIAPQAGVFNVIGAPVGGVPAQIANIPVTTVDAPGDVQSLVIIAGSSATTHAAATSVPEVNHVRPLVAGLQIENFDDDDRRRVAGTLKPGFLIVGTLGCFVKLSNGDIALLSNNHVVAAENHGINGSDQIYQPGSLSSNPALEVSQLASFKPIMPSPAGTMPPSPGVVWNDIDAGVAKLTAAISFHQGYLSVRGLVKPHAMAAAKLGDSVFKVGRTTGLTRGTVTSVATVVGPIPYRDGPSWFRDSFEIEGINGTQFSDHGDSGSAIVRDNGEIVGLLYAGNGQQTYACPMDAVFRFFDCTLA
jgi:hypothetical protein